MNEQQMQFSYDRRRTSTLTLDEQPGAHTGATRKYIPGYSDSNIVFLNTSTGNDANTGASIAQALLTYSAAVTAAGTTKKIRLVNSATLTSNITKPTEATIGTTSTISATASTCIETVNASASTSSGNSIFGVAWSPELALFAAVGKTGAEASYFTYSTNGTTWSESASTIADNSINSVAWSSRLALFVAVGYNVSTNASVYYYSTNGTTWTASGSTSPDRQMRAVEWSDSLGVFAAVGSRAAYSACYAYSSDGVTWTNSDSESANAIVGSVSWSKPLGMFVSGGNTLAGESYFAYSSDGMNWAGSASTTASRSVSGIAWSTDLSLFVAVGATASGGSYFAYSSDGIIWSDSATTTANRTSSAVSWCGGLSMFVATGYTSANASVYYYSTNGTTWTNSAASTADRFMSASAWSPLLNLYVAAGIVYSTSSSYYAYSTAIACTISASVAGFAVNAALYSGTVTAYNCTLKQPGTTAALSLDACRVTESGSHISNNAVTSRATLYEGDRHLTCTPASQNAIDLNLDTWGGTFYIYNASQTGYERIRDCIGNGPIVANYPVTVGGRANVEGTSVNVLFDAEVTHNDPRFVDETDYKLEFQTNGYTRNSFAAARSNIYFNSAGDARDIGAWSYVESAVSHYYAKTEVMYKGEISHGLEFALNEQQGDSGVVSVYGNTRRVKEVITITYGTTYDREKAIFEYMLTLQDKGVKIQLDAEWNDNAGTVVVNGNQAAGVEFLTVDSTTYYEGMWLTISGEQYWIMRASPSPSAATKLILDRPLEDSVLDNDVIVRNYPAGAGEYQFSGPMNLTMKRVHSTALQGYYSGFQIRLVRKKQ